MISDIDEYINEILTQNSQSIKTSKKKYFFEKIKNTFLDNIKPDQYENLHKDINQKTIKPPEKIMCENYENNNDRTACGKQRKFKLNSKIPKEKNPLKNNVILRYDGMQNLSSQLIDFNMDISINIITVKKINDFCIFIRNFLNEIDEDLFLEVKSIIKQTIFKIIDKALSNKIFNSIITRVKNILKDTMLNFIAKNTNIE